MTLRRTRIVAALALALPLAAPPASAGDGFDTVVIDPGHGGEDHGARGPFDLIEKSLVLDVSKRLAAQLRGMGLDVVLTRDSDETLSLERRTQIANDARGDLFLSIHANSAPVPSARGVEIYFVSLEASDEQSRRVAQRENEALGVSRVTEPGGDDPLLAILSDLIATEHLMESDEFARLAESSLDGVATVRSRGVKQAPFVVLMGVQMPAALVEIGFLSNLAEAGALRTPDRRDQLSRALAAAVVQFAHRYDARRGIASDEPRLERGG